MRTPSPKVTAPTINRTVLMSGADFFDVLPINALSHNPGQIDRLAAVDDFVCIREAIKAAGITVIDTPAPLDCQDGIFTANWALVRGDTAVLASLPKQRQSELPAARDALAALGKRIIDAPYHFSGQGDALACGDLLFSGAGYRTDPRMHDFLQRELGYRVIPLRAVPEIDQQTGQPVINKLTGWPDSFFYDTDLGLNVIKKDLIIWYPGAWTKESQEKIKQAPVRKIEVQEDEAMNFACNLVSTGSTVVMSDRTPKLQAALEAEGLVTITLHAPELAKGGGFIRCTTLTLDND